MNNAATTHKTFPLLAGAYKSRKALDNRVSHVFRVDDTGYPVGNPLCGRALADHVCPDASTEEEENGRAGCPRCSKKDPRSH